MNSVAATVLCLSICMLLPSTARSQSIASPPGSHRTTAHASTTADTYVTEPYVIEKYNTRLTFENDGTAKHTVYTRIRVQNELAVTRFSNLTFNFDANQDQLALSFLRVLEPNGTIVTAAPGAVTEDVAAAVRDTPAYANVKQMHIAVPSLQPGDTVEYEIVTRTMHPPAPGEFWAQHTFVKDAIVLEETLEISVPSGRQIILRSPKIAYSTDTISSHSFIAYRWKTANLSIPDDAEKQSTLHEAHGTKQADVELTSFADWATVSRWYSQLQQSAAEPDPAIRAKVAEIVAHSSTDIEKIQAIYEYVSKNIRPVDLPLGTDGFVPHPASEIFKNQYADGKDQHVLLSAMLQAAGLQTNVALLAQSQKFDVEVPSPAQLDWTLTVVSLAKDLIWMDSAAEVAPFRFLPPSLRHKPALLISADGSGKIVETPLDPPYLSTQSVQIEGQVNDLGKLSAHIRYQLRGDNEFALRLAFRRTPQAQWKELGQTLLTLDGLHGNVASAKSSDPLDTRDPFEVDLEYTQPDFLDWSARTDKVALPLLAIGLPDPPKDVALPVILGSPLNVSTRLRLSLASKFSAAPPVGIAVTRDYAEFKSNYQWQDGVLTAERLLNFRLRQIPESRRGDYLAFTHAVEADQTQPLTIAREATTTPLVPSAASAQELFDAGASALAHNNANSAIPLLQRVVELEPAHREAWNELGLAYLRSAQFDRAVSAFEKQLQVNPSDEHAYNYLGLAFQRQQNYAGAVASFRKQIGINPLDTVAHAALGTILLSQEQYSEAASELDKATVLSPDKAELQISLGQAYINLGDNEKAVAAFRRAVEISPTPAIWNNAAYNLADHRAEISTAQKYAESAVAASAAGLAKLDPARGDSQYATKLVSLANDWDTLGWVYFQKGDIDSAERYIRAAWLLVQDGEIADHLAQIYSKRGDKQEALRIYAFALAASHPSPDARAHLTLALGGNSKIDQLAEQAKASLAGIRTFPAGKLLSERAQAEFAIVLSPGKDSASPHIETVRFLNGSEKLRPFADRLRTIDYGPMFPGASPLKLVRRGTLSCSPATSGCDFILIPVDETAVGN